MEHVPNDWAVIERQIWAAKAYDVDVLVRVAQGQLSDLIRPLEMDAAGIMIPHVMSLADAKQIIHHTKFHPIGRRPLDGGNADGAFCNLELGDYISQANEQRFNVLQIEDPEPLSELEEIDCTAWTGHDLLRSRGFQPRHWRTLASGTTHCCWKHANWLRSSLRNTANSQER